MSACLRPVSEKERRKRKKNTKKTQDQLVPGDCSKAGALSGGTSCLPFKLSAPSASNLSDELYSVVKEIGGGKEFKVLADNFSNLWSFGMLFFLRLICFDGKTGKANLHFK